MDLIEEMRVLQIKLHEIYTKIWGILHKEKGIDIGH